MSQRHISFLLGAGASVDAGMPASVDMTEAVIGRLNERDQTAVLEFVRHTIAADIAQREATAGGRFTALEVEVDVERLFATVDLLAHRLDQPLAPFVGGWHPGLERFGSVVGDNRFFSRIELERDLARGGREVARAIERFVDTAVARIRGADVSELLVRVRDSMLRSLFEILNIEDPESVRYLTPLIDLSRSQGDLVVATLNYDRSVENVADLHGDKCHTGIDNWVNTGAVDWPADGLSLMKLHGSVDWVFEPMHRERGKLPRQAVRTVSGLDEKSRYASPAVVFGEAGKLRAEGPFLELLLAWSERLGSSDSLVVAGYSFRDPHVNEMIARWFNSRDDRRVVVVNPIAPPTPSRESFSWGLTHVDGGQEPPSFPRYVHVEATTADGLSHAIQVAAESAPPAGG